MRHATRLVAVIVWGLLALAFAAAGVLASGWWAALALLCALVAAALADAGGY